MTGSIKKLGPNLYLVRLQWRDPKAPARKKSLQRRVTGSHRDARRALDELRVEAAAGGRRKVQTLRDYSRSWIAARAATLKPSVARKYATSLGLHILPVLGDHRLDRLEPSDVQAYVHDRVGAKAAGNTVLNELRLLRAIARDSMADGSAPRNWADRVKPPAVAAYTEDHPNLLQAGELRALLAAVPKPWLPIVTMMAFTGLRWGEASALRWEDLDLARGLVKVRRSNWKGRALTPKTERSVRTVPLPVELGAVFATVPKRRRRGWLFPTKEGELHRGTPLRDVLDAACVRAGVTRITTHGLRRTFNNLARQEAAREVVKAVTGHTTDAMLEHYSLVGHDEKKRLTDAVVAVVQSADRDRDPVVGRDEGEDGDPGGPAPEAAMRDLPEPEDEGTP